MSPSGNSSQRQDSAEQRAEELLERLVNDGSRLLNRVAGRIREEVEDIVAEARTRNERSSAKRDD